jgi:hypothetical protein
MLCLAIGSLVMVIRKGLFIGLLDEVVHAFCVNATEGLQQIANAKKWHIVTPLSIMETVRSVLHSF